MTTDGRPLSFLAVVDLTELPPSALPDAGFLLFYADLDNDEARGLIEPVGNDAGSPARVLYVAPEDEPLPATAPPGSIALNDRPVAAVQQLTLPDDYEVAERLGLDPAAASVYQEIAEQLRYGAKPNQSLGDHWVLGAVTGVQRHPVEPETVLLLHLAYDEELEFLFLDGGAIQFRIPEAALLARDWSAVRIEPDSA